MLRGLALTSAFVSFSADFRVHQHFGRAFQGGTAATVDLAAGHAGFAGAGRAVNDAVTRYADRYGRTPAPDPERVVIEITIDRAMGLVNLGRPKTASTAA